MQYMGNTQFWDDKFAIRSDNQLQPEKTLVDNISYFKKGTVLDIACGDGRNALYLLERGFRVTGVDFSKKALERLDMFAKRKNFIADTKLVDLSVPNALSDLGVYENVLINHYRLSKEQLKNIENHISDRGILFACGFGYKHKVDINIREEDLIRLSDFDDIRKSFELVKEIELQEERGFFVTYIFQKNRPEAVYFK